MVAISPPASTTELDAPPAYDTTNRPGDLEIALVAQPSSHELLVSLTPPAEPQPTGEKKAGHRAPIDLCLVIDVSGSMNTEAPVPGKQDKNETTGLSVLDIVKHATRTIIESMDDNDRIAIVTFSDSAEIVAPLTVMNKGNREKVWGTVENLRTRGMTNLWDGLKTGMNVLTRNIPASKLASPSSSTPPQLPLNSSPMPATRGKRRSLWPSTGLVDQAQPPLLPTHEPKFDIKIPTVETPESPPSTQLDNSERRLSALFILTDGQPNIEPPRGHIPMLKTYLDSLSSNAPKFTISTFGFGYSLDSRLLDEIADLGQGMYGFIPDSGMVGTVFVHALANLIATWATGCILDVEVITEDPNTDAKVVVLGALPVTYSSWGASIRVGDIQYGQSKDFVIKLSSECFGSSPRQTVNIAAKYLPHTHSDKDRLPLLTRALGPNHEVETSVTLQHHVFRLSFVCAVSKIFRGSKKTSTTCPVTQSQFEQSISKYLNNPALENYEPSKSLAMDINSQVILGLEPKNWSRWGMHYIPSIARSHQRQQCLNFKDEGLQVYGRDSNIFTSTRDRIDQTFDSLPPPTPSLKDQVVYRPGNSVPASYCAAKSMAVYRSSAGPCFAGWCHVSTERGKIKLSELERGAIVRTPKGTARVAAILRTACPGHTANLCTFGQLVITPWHPMHHNGSWMFPTRIQQPKSLPCDHVYSILLESSSDSDSHSVFIEGIRCVTLGHGCTDPVRAHPFLGDYARIVGSLSQLEGYYGESGVVDCAGVDRESGTGMICGFRRLERNEAGTSRPCAPWQVACEV
ncbi:unnamed protein product [Rhizoctonia solani]|uniref:VWFA domain-containing protein n=1 Tax=Rhizoctonia solani TaxID=456999 RepID=A0A8H3ARZ5_9AGAM|nr:unnamed protein product [Rhizoctonia solani]